MEQKLIDLTHFTQQPLKEIRSYCKKHNLTIAVAESVTAGAIQLLLSNSESATDFFQGGITTYNCSQKSTHLYVEPISAYSCNGVDESITKQMAGEVCRLFRSQIGIGITGYATKIPEEGITALYAFVSIVLNGKFICNEKLEAAEQGLPAQLAYATQVITLLAAQLSNEK